MPKRLGSREIISVLEEHGFRFCREDLLLEDETSDS